MAPPPDPFEATRRHAPSSAGAERVRPRLRWTDASGPHEVLLDRRVRVGSAPFNEVVIADPAVSRLHAELEPRDDGVWVRDLGSTNGTFVNGVLVLSGRVPDGGSVRFAGAQATISPERTRASVARWHTDSFGPLVGRSDAMHEIFAQLARIAASRVTALIQGETGTGKELAARAIHEASDRATGPFVVVDCAGLPESLLEGELFGHARGAFTGAVAAREGAIEAADGGTLFLDELGELPLAMQPKLLRAIESRTVRRLGETGYRPVDVRFVSATHRDLESMVNAGAFREDLYFRLAVVPVTLPPLREHPEDIALLVAKFLEGSDEPVPDEATMATLAARPWLGNVRELRNFVDRARVLGVDDALGSPAFRNTRPPMPPVETAPDASPPTSEPDPDAQSIEVPPIVLDAPLRDLRERLVREFERRYLAIILQRHRGSVATAAGSAGLDRTHFYRLLKKHGL